MRAKWEPRNSGRHVNQLIADPSLEALAVFQHPCDGELLKSVHVYVQGPRLYSIQQDLLLSPINYCVLNEPIKRMIPDWAMMANFMAGQKEVLAADGWQCILDFAVYAPLPSSMRPLLAPSRNPFLSFLPSLFEDLTFVEAVIRNGCQDGREAQPPGHVQSLCSPSSACLTQRSSGQSAPFIGSRSRSGFRLPSPRLASGLESSSPQGSLWNDVGSFTDLLSSASPRLPIPPLGLLHPNFPSPAESSEKAPGPFSKDGKPLKAGAARSFPAPSPRLPRGHLYEPPGGFGGEPGLDPRANSSFPGTSCNFSPFVPTFFPDPTGDRPAHSELKEHLAFLAEYPPYAGPGVTPESLFASAHKRHRVQRQEGDLEKPGRLFRPPPRLEIPLQIHPAENSGHRDEPDIFSCAELSESKAPLPRSRSTQPGPRPLENGQLPFQRASSAPAEIAVRANPPLIEDPLLEPALLSPLVGRCVMSDGDPPASLWVCINAGASERVRPGVSFLPGATLVRTRSGGSNCSVGTTPSFLSGDQTVPRCPHPRFEKQDLLASSGENNSPVENQPGGLFSTSPLSETSPRELEPGADRFLRMASSLTSSDFGRSSLSPHSPLRNRDSFQPSNCNGDSFYQGGCYGATWAGAMEGPVPSGCVAESGRSPGLFVDTGPESPLSLEERKVKSLVILRDPKKATERMNRMTLPELQTYFGMPITDACKLLGVGLTVLKKRCRDFNIPRWPHRKIKSIKGLINTIKELAQTEDGSEAAPIGHAIQRLENEREQIEGTPSIAMAQDTKKLRQACFKANFKIRSLASGRNPRTARCKRGTFKPSSASTGGSAMTWPGERLHAGRHDVTTGGHEEHVTSSYA